MYTQSITRSHRTAFILAIDQSGSMAEKLLFRGRQTTKAEAVAEVTNRLLFELIERARRSDEVRDYYDIAVLGYSGDGIVSLLNDPEPLVPVSRLAALPVDFAETVVERRMPDGEATFRKISMPAWIAPKAVGQDIDNYDFVQLKNGNGYDHNWVLNTKGDISSVAAKLTSPDSGITLEVYTDEPGIQVYTGNFLDGTVTGKKGIVYNQRASVCLETQHYPDSPNKADWPSVVVRPGEKYHSTCIYKFGAE